MRNDTVSAAGEAMPAANINRRRMLTSMATIPACGLAAIVPVAAVALPVIDRKARIKEMIYDLEQLPAEETGRPWKSLLLTSPSEPKDIMSLGTSSMGFHDPFGVIGQPMHFGKPVEGGEA